MDTEKKETSETLDREALVKGLTDFIDQTIAEVEELTKGEVTFKDLSLQPDEQGDMPKEAGQPADDFKGMKKEDPKAEEKEEEEPKKEEEKEEEKPLEKEIPAELSEPKKEEAKEGEEKEDEEEKEPEEKEEEAEKACKSEEDAEYEKFKKYLHKALSDLGLFAEKTEEKKEEPVAKSEEKAEVAPEAPKVEEAPKAEDELKKALEARDSKIEGLEKTVKELTEAVDKMSRIPQARKSIGGLKPIRKSESDGSEGAGEEPLKKGEVLDKLVDLLKSGDKRVNPALITKFELTGDPELVRDILRK